MFAQMKFFERKVEREDVDVFCGAHQEDCGMQTQFAANAHLLQWSWNGKRTPILWTTEGMCLASVVIGLFIFPTLLVFRSTKWKLT